MSLRLARKRAGNPAEESSVGRYYCGKGPQVKAGSITLHLGMLTHIPRDLRKNLGSRPEHTPQAAEIANSAENCRGDWK